MFNAKMGSAELSFLHLFQDISPLPVLSIDLSTPSQQVMLNDLYVNVINDRDDDSEYGSEYGSEDDSLISLEMHLIS